MGFAAACIFHYQPANLVEYENTLRNSELSVVIPSECIHRSFLSQPNDVISITCPTCNSLVSLFTTTLTVRRALLFCLGFFLNIDIFQGQKDYYLETYLR